MTAWQLLGWGTLAVCLLQGGLWLWHLRKDNAGWVDVGWALGLGGLALFYAWAGSGDPLRRGLVALMGGGWGLRLGAHLWHRVGTDLHEDGRYQAMRAAWGGNVRLKFLGFFQAQALLDVALSTPFLWVVLDARPVDSAWTWAGMALWAVALVGEALADGQLCSFKANPANRGRTCRAGLWRVSRHPNYFFEWLVWVAFALLATGSPWGWTAWACPALMLYFLLRVTGIPYTEAQSLRSRPDDYRRYQRETHAFFPWFPKKALP